jgi:DNA modification methylase
VAVLHHGDALDVLPTLAEASFDCVLTDPPYPHVARSYGCWTEAEWWALMRPVVAEVRRLLKPTGSAVFILQPNSERVGRMRPWLWEFLAWLCREWNVVQDAWWWNYAALTQHCSIQAGLMKPSIKACVWCGPADCWRDQEAVLWDVSDYTVKQAIRSAGRARRHFPSGHSVKDDRACQSAIDRGGAAPPNLIPCANSRGHTTAGAHGHGAGTPLALCGWWLKYICPPGGRMLDPFAGSGTTLLACEKTGRRWVGVEKEASYCDIARQRLAGLRAETPLFPEAEQGS